MSEDWPKQVEAKDVRWQKPTGNKIMNDKIEALIAEAIAGVIAPIDARLKALEAIIGPVDHPTIKALIAEVIAPIDDRLRALEAIVGPQD